MDVSTVVEDDIRLVVKDVSTGVEDDIRLVVKDVSIEVEDVTEIRLVKLGETELPSPELEPLAVTIPPDVDGVVLGTTTSINFDVRKQTTQPVSITLTRCS